MRLSLRPPQISRIVALFTLLSFVPNTLFAVPAPTVEREGALSSAADPFQLLSDALPQEWGRIQETHSASREKLFILIQDAHAIPDAQKSLYRLVEYLAQHYGIDQVALEGSSEAIDTTLLRNFPDSEKLKQVFESYLGRGELSGAAAAAFLSENPARYFGVESQALYEEGIDFFLQALQQESEQLEKLAPQREAINRQKKESYPARFQEFERLWESWQKDTSKFSEFVSFLNSLEKEVPALALQPKNFPQLFSLVKQLEHENLSDSAALRPGLLNVGEEIRKRLGVQDDTEKKFLEGALQEYRTERKNPLVLAQEYLRIARHHQWQDLEQEIQNLPGLGTLLSLNPSAESFHGEGLWQELASYHGTVQEHFLSTETLKRISAEARALHLAEKLVRMELMRDEWQEWEARSASPEMKFSVQEAFYKNAVAREKAMFENLLQKTADQNSKASILVTGGFHTEGLRRQLREQQISYVLIAPSIQEIPAATHYHDYMRGKVSWESYFEIKDGRVDLYEAFNRAVRDQLLKEISSPKIWRDRVIQTLAAEKRLDQAQRYTRFIDETMEKGGSNHKEKEALRTKWFQEARRFFQGVRDLKTKDQLTASQVLNLLPKATAPAPAAVPAGSIAAKLISGETRRARVQLTPQTGSRAESRFLRWDTDYAARAGLNRVKNATVISLQWEVGYAKTFAQAIQKKIDTMTDEEIQKEFPKLLEKLAAWRAANPRRKQQSNGKIVADWVIQASMTGGLGALMHDYFPSWKANSLDIIGITPLWSEIKKKPYPEGPLQLDKIQRQVLEENMRQRGETPISFSIEMPWDQEFVDYAEKSRSIKTVQAANKKIHFLAYRDLSDYYPAPNYRLYAYYLKDESQPDTESNRVTLFEEVYTDDQPFRETHMGAFSRGAQELIRILKNQGVVKKKTVEIHNEAFVSMPKLQSDPDRVIIHVNHSAYAPTMPRPNVYARKMIGLPNSELPFTQVNRDNNGNPMSPQINIVEYVSRQYDAITGVAIDEHFNVLYKSVFPNAGNRLRYFYDGNISSSNGALVEHWQDLSLQMLLEHFRVKLDLPLDTESVKVYEAIEKNAELLQEFKKKQAFIKAAAVYRFLLWMKDTQGQPAWYDKAVANRANAFEEFDRRVAEAAASNNAQKWQDLYSQHEAMKNLLLSRPMISNARRWVPYKGPEKWDEVLSLIEAGNFKAMGHLFHELEKDKHLLEQFKREVQTRVVIGGRTFSDGADTEFQNMRNKAHVLGLDDHFAFIESYNLYDAPTMFQAMSGVVMISDENLEAAATSNVKGLENGAALIGPWAGRNPELFLIQDEKGNIRKIMDIRTPQDLILKNVRSGKWKIINGFLVGFSNELSRQDGGGRRPDANDLLQSLFWMSHKFEKPESRENLLWYALKSSSVANMREGQARAIMHMIDELLIEREHQNAVLASLQFSASALKNLVQDKERFAWRESSEKPVSLSQLHDAGLMGLIEEFDYAMAPTDAALKDRAGAASRAMRYAALHHAEEAAGRPESLEQLDSNGTLRLEGDIFYFIKDRLSLLGAEFQPLRDEIQRLTMQTRQQILKFIAAERKRVKMAADLRNARGQTEIDDRQEQLDLQVYEVELLRRAIVNLNHHAMRLIEDAVYELAQQALENYLRLDPQQNAEDIQFYNKNIFSARLFRKYISRSLEQNPNAVKLDTKNAGLPAYVVSEPESGRLVLINVGERPTRYDDQRPEHGRGTINHDKVFEKFLESQGIQRGDTFQVVNPALNEEYSFYKFGDSVRIGVPEPEGVQVLSIRKVSKTLTRLSQGDIAGFANLLKLTYETEPNEDPQAAKARLHELLAPIARLPAREVYRLFEKNVPRIMALIAGLDPSLLELMKDWNIMVYANLKRVMAENPGVFSTANGIRFQAVTEKNNAIVFSRQAQNNPEHNVLFQIVFNEREWDRPSGTVRLDVPLNMDLEANALYRIDNLINKESEFSEKNTGVTLSQHFQSSIPIEDRKTGRFKTQHGWGFGVYRVVKVIPDPKTVTLDEDGLAPVKAPDFTIPVISGFMLAQNLMDTGAEFDPETGNRIYVDSLRKTAKLDRFLEALGFGKKYFYNGTFPMDVLPVHTVPHNGEHFRVDDESHPTTMVRVSGYSTKQEKRQVGGREILLQDDQGNGFSNLNLIEANPKLSTKRENGELVAGTAQLSESQIIELIQRVRLKSQPIFDFMVWRGPSAVNEQNYKRHFYYEFPEEVNRAFQALETEDQKTKFMESIYAPMDRNQAIMAIPNLEDKRRVYEAIKDQYFVVKRFPSERLILVRHLFGESNVDQVQPNIFNPSIQEELFQDLKTQIDRGSRLVRIDLAHHLLNSDLRRLFDAWGNNGWKTEGAYDPSQTPLQELIQRAKAYAVSVGKEIETIAETYNYDEQVELKKAGIDYSYHVDNKMLHDARKLVKYEINAGHIQETLRHVVGLEQQSNLPAQLLAWTSFDDERRTSFGMARWAMDFIDLLLAKTGSQVMMDLSDLLGHSGALIPVVGDRHMNPSQAETQMRADFAGLVRQLETSPVVQIFKNYSQLGLPPGIMKRAFLNNSRASQFFSMALFDSADKSGEVFVALVHLNPEEDEMVNVDLPMLNAASGNIKVVDAMTGETFSTADNRIQGVSMPSTLPYRVLKVTTTPAAVLPRAEVRPLTFFQQVDGLVLDLAAGRFQAPQAEQLVSLVNSPSGQTVLNYAGRAIASPAALELYQTRVMGADSPELYTSAQLEKFLAEHPDYEQVLEQSVAFTTKNMRDAAQNYFSEKPYGKLNFAFALSLTGVKPTDKIPAQILEYLETIKAVRAEFAEHEIKANIRVLMTDAQLRNPEWRGFLRELGRSGMGKAISTERLSASAKLNEYFNKNANAMVYGTAFSDFDLAERHRLRFVESQIPLQSAMPLAFAVSNHLAENKMLEAETLGKLTEVLGTRGEMRWNGTTLEITTVALHFAYQAQKKFQLSA